MNIVIVGAGEVGTHIAKHLISERKDVVIIEKDPECARQANEELDCLVIQGEGTNINTLIEAGINKADIFIAATSVDEVNMISCLVAMSEFNIPVKIARIRNVEYMRAGFFDKSLIGIDHIVNPEIEAAREITELVEHGASTDIFSFDGTDAQLRNLVITGDSQFNGVYLKDLPSLFKEKFIVAGVLRDDNIIVPSGEFQMEEGDQVYIVANGRSFKKLLIQSGSKISKIRSVIVLGGGRMGRYAIRALLDSGCEVHVVEKDYPECVRLATDFPDIMVTNGDIADKELFDEEHFSYADAIITTTSNDEFNILAGVFAKYQGVERAISLVDNFNYTILATNLGIDACVTPKLSSVDAILKFIRRGNIRNVYTIFDGQAEVIEFSVSANSAVAGKEIMNMKLPKGCLIVAVQRGRETIIPDGHFVVEGGDSIITFVTIDSISKLEDMLVS